MFIEKSPFFINNSKAKNFHFDKKHHFEVNKADAKNIKESENSFSILKWIKGVINPLQNLPLVSGIYSSINSEDPESDRDMIQNGLGGFLYGGPIGAIAGVGNWVFNKIFNNTPAEMFFSLTGIDSLWQDKPQDKKIATIEKDFNDIPINNLSEKMTMKTNEKSSLNPQEIIKKKNIQNNKILDMKNENFNNSNSKKDLNNSKFKNNVIEFNYPKWEPNNKEYINKNNKNLNLSKMEIIYNIAQDKGSKNIVIKA